MNILISTLSQTPIYQQIQNQIKEMILNGKLEPETQLPSIRLMAKDLKVGIITVKRAYKELEDEGIVVNLQGRGCFVAKLDKDRIKQVHIDMLKERLYEIKEFTDSTGINQNELMEVINDLWGYKNDK
ncbi:MAG: GntR family transcriptional regulator [Clostridiaceae bacterium]